MGAKLTDDVPVRNLIEPSGYNIPEELVGKTWGDVKASGDVTLVELTATANNVYTPDAGKAYKKVTVNVPTPAAVLSAWKNDTAIIYTKVAEPTTTDKALVPAATGLSEAAITAVADEFASITVSATEYTRYAEGDVTVVAAS